MPAPANSPRSLPVALERAAWPPAAAAEAMYAMARESGLPAAAAEAEAMPDGLAAREFNAWMEAAAERGALQADQLFGGLNELESLLAISAPALVRLGISNDALLLAVLDSRPRATRVVGPDLRVRTVPTGAICKCIRQPFESPIAGEIDQTLDRMRLSERARGRARRAMLADRLAQARFRGCWRISLPPGAPARAQSAEAGFGRSVATLALAQVAQYALFIFSWWLLGRSVLQGTADRGWILGWLLLLMSLVPLRMLSTWKQGIVSVSAGVWLRRRLLRGAFRIDRQEIRRKGAGQLFGLVVEAAAIDSLALTGGIVAAFALIELVVASAVLWAGATALLVPLLGAWIALAAFWTWQYAGRRSAWTSERLALSEQLLESMVGHRTRLVQQHGDAQHAREDELLARYIDQSRSMDGTGVLLSAVVPRGWLVVSLGFLGAALVSGASPTRLAISVGAILLAYRSLQRLSAGLANLTGAVVAARTVAPLVRAAARREAAALPLAAAAGRQARTAGSEPPIAVARDLTFRYRTQGDAVLQGCNLSIPRGTRLLLEGPSGSGKTTLAAILAGLQPQDSGLLLLDGLDRAALGAAGWRSRVVMAPQAHDNYLLGGTLAFNLLMGGHWPPEREDLAEAETVCRELGLGDLLNRLPGGLQQMVGETGWQLSQGERIRVFLARALLQKPDLLILDESFSALDADNVDRAIRTVIQRAPTVLAIAHP